MFYYYYSKNRDSLVNLQTNATKKNFSLPPLGNKYVIDQVFPYYFTFFQLLRFVVGINADNQPLMIA